jgi:hypothetical protein
MDPFEQFDGYLLGRALKKAHIQEKTWGNLREIYQKIDNEYDPAILEEVNDYEFIQITNQFFDFKKATTIETRKTAFTKWLKVNWKYFKARTFNDLCANIVSGLNTYNEENPDEKLLCINWIPVYGGLLCEPPRSPNELEISYKTDKNIHYPIQPH